MEASTPFPESFAKNPIQKHERHDAITAALLEFDEPVLLIRERSSQSERAEIALSDSTD